jgi:hypothetical protein
MRLRLVAALALAAVAILCTPRTAFACLAYVGRTDFGVGERPAGAAVGVIVEKIGYNDYILEIEEVVSGEWASRVSFADNDGCHLPVLAIGQRLLIAPYYHYARDAVYYGRLGIWALDDQDAVLATAGHITLDPANVWHSHTIGRVIPTSLQQAIAQMGLLPDTAADPPQPDPVWPGLLGMYLLTGAILSWIGVSKGRRDKLHRN